MLGDIEMSQMAKRDGYNTALLAGASEDSINLNEGLQPSIGRQAFLDQSGGQPGPTTIPRWPAETRVASSGDLAYSWGHWKWTARNTVYDGSYFSAWRRSDGGKRQLVLDGGSTAPPW